jgi:hypothetical protein
MCPPSDSGAASVLPYYSLRSAHSPEQSHNDRWAGGSCDTPVSLPRQNVWTSPVALTSNGRYLTPF